MKEIRIMVVDDHKLVREGLSKLLELEKDFKVVGQASSCDEAIRKVFSCKPDLVLVDMNMPEISGAELADRLRRACPGCKVVAVTAYDDPATLAQFERMRLDGFVLKASGLKELFSAIRTVMEGGRYLDPKVEAKMPSPEESAELCPLEELTPREREIVDLVAQGYANRDIAEKLVISQKTVKNHISRILKKLRLRDRTQLAIMVHRGLPTARRRP